jgi:trans-aconitate methyltransferase
MPHEFNGEQYKQASTHQKEWGVQLIAELGLEGHERVLDLGCGDGVLTAVLADSLPKGAVVGVDASRGMLDSALKNQRDNLVFELKDIQALDFTAEFDLVFSNASLHWVKDHRLLLEAVYKALKPDGRVRFSFAGSGNCPTFIKVVREYMQIPQYRRYFENFAWPWFMPDAEEYAALLHSTPFKNSRVWTGNADRYFPDAAAMTAWLDQPCLVPFKQVLQPPGRTFFRDLVVEKVLAEAKQPDGRYFEKFVRLNVSAQK